MKYINVKPSPALDSFVRKQCSSLAQRLESHPNKYKISLSIKANSKNTEGRVTTYEVIGAIKIARQGQLRVSKKGHDPKKLVSSVVDALNKQLRRQTEKQERSRKTLGRSLKPVRHTIWELTSS